VTILIPLSLIRLQFFCLSNLSSERKRDREREKEGRKGIEIAKYYNSLSEEFPTLFVPEAVCIKKNTP